MLTSYLNTDILALQPEFQRQGFLAVTTGGALDAPSWLPAGSYQCVEAITIPGYSYPLPTIFNREFW
jgi:hypothetical protein